MKLEIKHDFNYVNLRNGYTSMMFSEWIFAILRKMFSKKKILLQIPWFFEKHSPKTRFQKFATIVYNMKWYLRFYTFIF
jgi:hypothetical protein